MSGLSRHVGIPNIYFTELNFYPTPPAHPQEILLSRMNLSSTIPHSVGNLTNLENLELYGNKLEGELPDLSANKNLKVHYLLAVASFCVVAMLVLYAKRHMLIYYLSSFSIEIL